MATILVPVVELAMSGRYGFSVILEPDEDGGYTALVPELPGVVTEGDSLDEALANAREAIELCLEDLIQHRLGVPATGPDV
jgi:antitoxin HicB